MEGEGSGIIKAVEEISAVGKRSRQELTREQSIPTVPPPKQSAYSKEKQSVNGEQRRMRPRPGNRLFLIDITNSHVPDAHGAGNGIDWEEGSCRNRVLKALDLR
jgi:hypothetical protein